MAAVKGVPRLSGAARVLAGLNAEEGTTVEDIEHIARGREQLEEKLLGLDARIQREE